MYAPVMVMRWYEVQSDMRVDWCSAAVAAMARSAVGRTAVATGPDDAMMGNWLDDGTGKEVEGFVTMVLPELEGREVRGSKRSQGILPEHLSAYAHIVGFRPPPVTSRVVQRKGMHLNMVLPELGGREVKRSKRSQGRDITRVRAHRGLLPTPCD